MDKIIKLLFAISMLALTTLLIVISVLLISDMANAGEITGPAPEGELHPGVLSYPSTLCTSEESVLFRLNNYQKIKSGEIEGPDDCFVSIIPETSTVTSEYMYLDDEGDELVIMTATNNGMTVWFPTIPQYLIQDSGA